MQQNHEREYSELDPSTNGNLAQIMLCWNGNFEDGQFCERECVVEEAMNGNSANGNV